jgi:hypothetical protein
VITLDSYTVQCRTCALAWSTSQRMCTTCFEKGDAAHKSQHQFVRVLQKLGPTTDKKTRLICNECPELGNDDQVDVFELQCLLIWSPATKEFHSRLKFEDGHSELTIQICPADAEYKRLWEYRICALQARPSTMLHTPSPCCSSCGNCGFSPIEIHRP